MTGETIKTLAEYIAKLRRQNTGLEHPENYMNNVVDTNGVTQDQVEQAPPVSSQANRQ